MSRQAPHDPSVRFADTSPRIAWGGSTFATAGHAYTRSIWRRPKMPYGLTMRTRIIST